MAALLGQQGLSLIMLKQLRVIKRAEFHGGPRAEPARECRTETQLRDVLGAQAIIIAAECTIAQSCKAARPFTSS